MGNINDYVERQARPAQKTTKPANTAPKAKTAAKKKRKPAGKRKPDVKTETPKPEAKHSS